MTSEKCFREKVESFQQKQLIRFSEHDRLNFLQQISVLDFKSKHDFMQQLRHPETCHWLFKEKDFELWDHSTGSAAFVLYCILGSGKASITLTELSATNMDSRLS